MAQARGREILARFEYVSFVAGPRDEDKVPLLINQAGQNGQQRALGNLAQQPSYTAVARSNRVSGYVTIMEGCDNFCSYCIVPYVRGREVSRSSLEILAEVREMAEQGYREVILLGQNVNSYNRSETDDRSFPELLEAVAQIEGIARIRFVTSHPKDFTPALIACFARLPKLCDSLHLPVQSGSDRILKLMNRGYTREHYLSLVKALKEVRPELVLSTDIIVGYPGETAADYEQTLELLSAVEFDTVFSFSYGVRPGTAAEKLKDSVPYSVKQARLLEIVKRQTAGSFSRNQGLIGKRLEVLITGEAKRKSDPQLMTGRSRSNRLVHLPGDHSLVGSMVWVTVTDASPNCLYGRLITKE